MDNTTEVVIGGEIITLRSAEEPMYMQKLARYVDQKMSELRKKSVSAAIDDKARTVIYALNIADDYLKTSEKLVRLEAVHKRFVVENGNLQKENGILSANVKALEAELARTRTENEKLRKNPENKIKPETKSETKPEAASEPSKPEARPEPVGGNTPSIKNTRKVAHK